MTAQKTSFVRLWAAGTIFLLWAWAPAPPSTAFDRNRPVPLTAVEAICGETLEYDVGFWFLPRAGTCRLTFKKNGDTYISEMEARPLGFVGVFIPYKKEVMKSVMAYDPEKRRLRPLEFHETYVMDDLEVEKALVFDYSKRVYHYTVRQNGRQVIDRTRRLPRKRFDDILTLIYNLRLGSYGRITEGRKLTVSVLMRQRPSRLSLYFDKQLPPHQRLGAYNAVLSLSRNVTNAKSDRVVCWFSETFVPLGGMIENAVFFGDLHLTLSHPSPKGPGETPPPR